MSPYPFSLLLRQVIAVLGMSCTDAYTNLPLPYEISSPYFVSYGQDQPLVVTPVTKLLQFTGLSRTPVQEAYGMLGVNASAALNGALLALKDPSSAIRCDY